MASPTAPAAIARRRFRPRARPAAFAAALALGLAGPALANQSFSRTILVVEGLPVQLGVFYLIDPNTCAPRARPRVAVERQGVLGEVQLREAPYVFNRQTNPRHCFGAKPDAVFVTYAPKEGAKGPDEVRFRVEYDDPSPSLGTWTVTYAVTVR